ncbi:MAG: hypothetical protein ACJA09_000389 [Alcanivorax sp.]|jgi:hypothetical protein
MVAEQFVKPVHRELLVVDTDYNALLDRMVEVDSAHGVQ